MSKGDAHFKAIKKRLTQLGRQGRRTYKAEALKVRLAQKDRFKKTGLFYGRPREKNLRYAFLQPALTYRYSAVLKDSIDFDLMSEALFYAAARFPALRLDVRAGFFSYYLEENGLIPELRPDTAEPAGSFDAERYCPMYRVLCYRHRISVELASALADFKLAKDFLYCLLLKYCELISGEAVEGAGEVHYLDRPNCAELEDPFEKLLSAEGKTPRRHGSKLRPDTDADCLNLTTLELSADELSRVCDEPDLYLTRIARQAAADKLGAPGGVLTDMRGYLPTETYRNFTVTEAEDEPMSVRRAKLLTGRLKRRGQRLKYLPMWFKRFIRKQDVEPFYAAAAGEFVPAGLAPYLVRTESAVGAKNAASVSWTKCGDRYVVSILSPLESAGLERAVSERLTSDGLTPKLDTNRRNFIL